MGIIALVALEIFYLKLVTMSARWPPAVSETIFLSPYDTFHRAYFSAFMGIIVLFALEIFYL